MKSFFNVWSIIKKRELYKYDRVIFDCMEKMCNDIDISVPIHHRVDDSVLIVLKKLFIDTMQIVVGFNNENCTKSPSRQISADSFHAHAAEVKENEPVTESEANHYDYRKFNLQELIRTHMEFIIVNRKQCFDIDELKQMLIISRNMSGTQKFFFLKTLLSFHNDWLENVQVNFKQNREEYVLCWKQLIKFLISSNVDHSINCVTQWLSIFIDESKFVLSTVANALSTDGSHKLGFAIANYATSDGIIDKKIDPQFMIYLHNSLGLCWKLNDTVLTDLDDEELNGFDQNDGVRTMQMSDHALFNV